MTTLLWKEIRENLRWALLAMIVLGGAELYALYQTSNGQPDYYNYNGGRITLCKPSFLTMTTFGSAAVGLLLGFIQVLPELKPDRWAALLHRPVSRGVIFLGKALAGLILYGIAAGVPFLFCLWLAATPGHFPAPFVPGLAYPGIANTCAGLVYYGAALVVALQRGGWRILKALPLLAALHLSFFVGSAGAFADALWAAGLMVAALGVAAWGAMYHQWSFSARPWLGKLAFFTVVFYGLCGIADLAQIVFGPKSEYNATNYELSEEGTPLKIRYLKGVVVSVEDLDGKATVDVNYKPDRIRNHTRYLNGCSSYIGNSHGLNLTRHYPQYRMGQEYLWAGYPFPYPRQEQWFYLVKERTAVGMAPNQKAMVARLDAHGFEPPSATPVPFPPGLEYGSLGQDKSYLWDAKSVRFVNLGQRKIIDLVPPVPGPVFGVTNIWARSEEGNNGAIAVALATAVAVYSDRDQSLVATLPYHQEMDRWGAVSVGMNAAGDRFSVRYDPSAWIPRKISRKMPSYLEEVDPQGKVLRAFTLPPLPNVSRPQPWITYLAERVESPAFFFGTLLYEKAGAALGNVRLADRLKAKLGEDWPHTKDIAKGVALLSFVFAGVTLWWARRVHFSWRRAWSWAGIALAFNLAGLLAFRLVADWPQLVPCAACQRPRPIDREGCPRCGDGWPELPLNGTEIYDHPAGQPASAAVSV